MEYCIARMARARVFRSGNRLGRASELGTLREPRGRGLRAHHRRMSVFQRAPAGLPPVPIDRLSGGTPGQIDQQQLQRIDELTELPIGQSRLGRHLLEVPRNLLGCQTSQGPRTPRLQELLDPANIPGTHVLRDAAVGQQVQIAVPVRGSAALRRRVGMVGIACGLSGLVRIQSRTLVARDKLVR